MTDDARRDSAGSDALEEGPADPDLDHLLEHLERLEETVDHPDERASVRETITVARRIPGLADLEERIVKYTTRDMAEAFVGSIFLSLPLLVEDGVFEIATHLASETVAGVPAFLLANVAFVIVLTTGLIYWADIRTVHVTHPLFGVVPRRLVGVLTISALAAAG